LMKSGVIRGWRKARRKISSSGARARAVAQLLNKAGGAPFDATDEKRLREFAASLGVVLETWWRSAAARLMADEADTEEDAEDHTFTEW